MPTPRERAEQKRQDKLDELDRLVKDGTVTVRQMTDEEREKYPPPSEEEQERRRNRPRRYGREAAAHLSAGRAGPPQARRALVRVGARLDHRAVVEPRFGQHVEHRS